MPKISQLDPATRAALKEAAGVNALATSAAFAYSTRAEIAAIASPSGVAMLREAGRQGLFIFDSSNLSAEVASDPLQGIYLPPANAPSGGAGAWVRIVNDGRYLAEWFGLAPGNTDAQDILSAVEAGAPSGSTIVLPGYAINLTAPFYAKKSDISWLGQGYATHIKCMWATLVDSTFSLAGNKQSARRIRFTGRYHNLNSGGDFCLAICSNISPDTGVAQHDITVEDCWFEDASEGIIIFQDRQGNDPENNKRVRNVRIANNRFRNLDYQAIAVWGVDGATLENNEITMLPRRLDPPNAFCPAVRILGAENVVVKGNRIWAGGTADGTGGVSAIYIAQAAVGGSSNLECRNVTVSGNSIANAHMAFIISGCHGLLEISRNHISNPSGATNNLNVFSMVGGAGIYDRVSIRDNHISGFKQLLSMDGGGAGHLVVRRNLFVSAGGTNLQTIVIQCFGVPLQFVEVLENTFAGGSHDGFVVATGTVAGDQLWVFDNFFPEGAATYGPIQISGGGAKYNARLATAGDSGYGSNRSRAYPAINTHALPPAAIA